MARDSDWARHEAARARPKGASSVACMVFVAAMGAAFWMGAIWASQTWMALTR
jgi:hypothetical protein